MRVSSTLSPKPSSFSETPGWAPRYKQCLLKRGIGLCGLRGSWFSLGLAKMEAGCTGMGPGFKVYSLALSSEWNGYLL